MEYPFKDLLPLDEVLEREGYYRDWTHLDPEVFYSLTQISEYIKTKGYGVDVRLLIAQLAEHFGLKTTQIVDLGNLLQAEHTSLKQQVQQAVAQVNADRNALETKFNQSVAKMEADKNAVIANATVDSEVILARGGKATLGKRLDETDARLAQNTQEILMKQKNLLVNTDFNTLPFISSRSDIYSFEAPSSKMFDGNNSLKISAVGYEDATGNKDFAMNMTHNMLPNEKIRIQFMVYPTISDKTMNVRLAYDNGININLGEANQWNKIDVTYTLTKLQKQSNFIFFNLLSSHTIYISKLKITDENETSVLNTKSESFHQVNQKINETPNIVANSPSIINKLIDVACSYVPHLDKFEDATNYTAFDHVCKRNTNNKFEIDCSSWVNLMLKGVTFENSRYNGHDENIYDADFLTNYDPHKYRYAHNIAKWCHERGYTFKAEKDFSNLRPGDMLFFSFNDPPIPATESYYNRVDHVSFYIDKLNENTWQTLQGNTPKVSVFHTATKDYMDDCVMVARVPLGGEPQGLTPSSNIVKNGDVTMVSSNVDVGVYDLTTPLESGSFYTLVMKSNGLNGNYIIVQDVENGNNLIYTDFGKTGEYSNTTVRTFLYKGLGTSKIRLSVSSNYQHNNEVTELMILKGYRPNETKYIPAKNMKPDILNINQVLKDDLDSGYVPSHYILREDNKVFINLYLPFKTAKTGRITLTKLPDEFIPANDIKIAVQVSNRNNGAFIPAVANIGKNGNVTIIPYSSSTEWNVVSINGYYFTNI